MKRQTRLPGTGRYRTGMRRPLALALLILTSAASVEAVVGVTRDGEVHHESPAVAATHAQRPSGDHGHEDGAPSGEHSHDEGHEHGTSTDHCTHVHSVALLTSPPPALAAEVAEISFTTSASPRETVSAGFAPPPRA